MLAGNEEGASPGPAVDGGRGLWLGGVMRDTTARTAAEGRKRMLNQNLKKNCYFGVKKHSHVFHEVPAAARPSKRCSGRSSV